MDHHPESDPADYWLHISKEPARALRGSQCDDCPFGRGFYQPLYQSLLGQSRVIQEAVASRWFCPVSPNMACRGLFEMIKGEAPHEFEM